jgi:hypothetical protein
MNLNRLISAEKDFEQMMNVTAIDDFGCCWG